MHETSQRPTQSSQPVSNKSSSHKNILFLLLFALVLILLTASTTYFVLQSGQTSQTPVQPTIIPTHILSNQPYPSVSNSDETANWRTYTNQQLNYQINLPQNWIEVEHSSNFNNFASYKAPDNSQFQVETENNKNQSLDQYLLNLDKTNSTGWEGEQSVIVKTSYEVMVDGYKGKERLEDKLPAGFTTLVTYVLIKDKIYIFTALPYGEEQSQNQEANKKYYRILSTFQFTN